MRWREALSWALADVLAAILCVAALPLALPFMAAAWLARHWDA